MRYSRVLPFAATLAVASIAPAQLAGSYAVGPGGNYANIAAAIADLTAVGVAAPVTFVVTANDTGPWTIPAFTGQGPTNPVLFDALGPITLSGTQPMLTLNGCASVTFRGFNGTFAASPNTFLINAGTADCVFTGCDFTATTATSGSTALFNFQGGSGCRIEDSRFGGAWEALYVGINASNTTIQRNRIIGGGWWIMRLAGPDTSLVNNFITGTSNYGISCGISGNTGSGLNLKVHNNSVFINHPTTSSQFCSLRWYSAATNNTEVIGNIFFDQYGATGALNMWCSGVLRPTTMNYNCLWSNIAGYTPVYASANRTFAAWQGLGFDVNSIQANPMYTAPTATPPDLTLQAGSPCSTTGTLLASVPTDYFGAPRTAPASIGAHEQDGGGPPAFYAVFGGGCAGSAGVPTNTASAPPRLGTTITITFGSLPASSLAIALIGLSNTSSSFGALPLDLTAYGAPGCFGRVSPDATTFLLGSGGTATFGFFTPSDANLLGFPFFTQALVLDSVNALGAVMSDAAAALVGI